MQYYPKTAVFLLFSVILVATNIAASPATSKATVDIFGRSVNGQPLRAYVYGSGDDVTMFIGAFHGNEPASAGVIERLKQYLERNPRILEGRKVILVPAVNPDGLERRSRVNARRVDVNRNFPYNWSPEARAERMNPGPEPASEPETRAVMALMEKYRPVKVVAIHQPFRMLNPSGEAGTALAREMARHNKYRVSDSVGYPTPGSFGQYSGRALGLAHVTLELPSGATNPAWAQNREALLAVIRYDARINPWPAPPVDEEAAVEAPTAEED
jgi:murein peptide amidase A